MATSQSGQADPFSAAVRRIFDGWSVLQLAVDNGFGGVDSIAKATWMVEAVKQWFTENSDLETFEVADFLADILNHEFNTIADDGSLGEVSKCICECYCLVRLGRDGELAERLAGLPSASKCHQQVSPQSDSESDDTEETMDTQETHSSVTEHTSQQTTPCTNGDIEPCNDISEEEGWTTVTKNKKR